jgi:tetratricopeptide (TPR) repeat protein
MKPAIFLSYLVFYSFLLNAQSNAETFRQCNLPSDSIKAREVLYKWEKSNPDDPNLYISYFNYFYKIAQNYQVSIGTGSSDKGIAFQDSSGREIGYISENNKYNSLLIDSGIFWINKGIAKYPNRLDMRFGKIYVFGRTEQYSLFTKELIHTINFADSIQYKWLLNENEPIPDPEEYFLGTIQEYVHQLFDAGDQYLPNMREVSEAVLKNHPNDVRFLSDVAVSYSLKNEFEKSLSYLQKAQKIAPKDYVILNNIANTYEQMKEWAQAIKYYELVIKNGDNPAKIAAKKKIQELKQKK